MKKKHIWLTLIALAVCIGTVVGLLSQTEAPAEETTHPEETPKYVETETSAEGTTAAREEKPAYQSPIDFKTLQEQNSDVYAWLDIPGSVISFPVLQRADDDGFYLHHNIDGEYEFSGAIYSEATYNSNDMKDPVTVLYGHQMLDGTMFSNLQEMYSDPDSFEKYSKIVVYTPEEELDYTVFAAVPYDNRHIMYTYDFSDAYESNAFFDTVYGIRTIGATFGEDDGPYDRVLILSTCLRGDKSKRYIVLAGLKKNANSARDDAELK